MKRFKYIFFFISMLLLFQNSVNANSYVVLNKQDINEVKNVLEKKDNVIINLNYNENLIAKRKVLDLIKNNNKSITYNILYNEEILYSYIFNGNFKKSYNDIDLKIYFKSDKDKYINEIFNTNRKIIVNTSYKGYYPTNTILHIENNRNINKLNLYNMRNNEFIEMNNMIKEDNNFINININKGDIYIISNKKIVHNDVIKLYLSLLIIFSIELFIFIIVIYLNNRIELPKKKVINS